MSERVILHSDMNSFYASVEMMLDPSLRGKAVAVCGSAADRHGIILAKSELAKKYGVKTGMANWQAKQVCPDLTLVPPHYEQYLKYSGLAREVYYRYTDLVEPFGMDECWLDISGSMRLFRSGPEVAEEIRSAMKEELGLTVSIGVSFNKVFAKLGSDLRKPDAVTVIPQSDFREIVWPLPASDMLYVGRSTGAKLARYGIHTIGQLAALSPELLQNWFGINGLMLWRYANGQDCSRVAHRDFVSPIKSVGHGITCNADLNDSDEVYKVILELSQDVGHRLRIHALKACGVQIAVRGNDLAGEMYQAPLTCPTRLPSEIAHEAFRLFRARYTWRTKVRAVTVRAITLIPESVPDQLCMFRDNRKMIRREDLQTAVEDVRRRYGTRALTYGILLGDLKMPDDGRELVKMPSATER